MLQFDIGGIDMKINYVGKNYKVSPRFKDILEGKLEKFNKFFNKTVEAKVNCEAQEHREKLEITISSGTYYFRAEAVSDNMYNNIDLVIPKLERQVTRVGSKIKARRTQDKNNVVFASFEDFVETDYSPTIAKKKRFTLEPMMVEDAEYHMEALGHDFYVFLNQKTNEVNLVYRRRDGRIGLIELEY